MTCKIIFFLISFRLYYLHSESSTTTQIKLHFWDWTMRKPPPSSASSSSTGGTRTGAQQTQHDRQLPAASAVSSTTYRIVMLWVFTSAFVTSQYFLARENKAKAREADLMAQIGALRRKAGGDIEFSAGHALAPITCSRHAGRGTTYGNKCE